MDWLVVKGVWGEGRMGTPKRAPLSVGTFFFTLFLLFFLITFCVW